MHKASLVINAVQKPYIGLLIFLKQMNSEPLKESSTSFGNIVTTGDKLTSFKASGEIPKPPMRNSNDSFTVDDEGGFTFIINNYAPILITGEVSMNY